QEKERIEQREKMGMIPPIFIPYKSASHDPMHYPYGSIPPQSWHPIGVSSTTSHPRMILLPPAHPSALPSLRLVAMPKPENDHVAPTPDQCQSRSLMYSAARTKPFLDGEMDDCVGMRRVRPYTIHQPGKSCQESVKTGSSNGMMAPWGSTRRYPMSVMIAPLGPNLIDTSGRKNELSRYDKHPQKEAMAELLRKHVEELERDKNRANLEEERKQMRMIQPPLKRAYHKFKNLARQEAADKRVMFPPKYTQCLPIRPLNRLVVMAKSPLSGERNLARQLLAANRQRPQKEMNFMEKLLYNEKSEVLKDARSPELPFPA
ncbi:hypothetical protein PENTCL1PPCAC_28976, partial [Pristionchus entomophagus]